MQAQRCGLLELANERRCSWPALSWADLQVLHREHGHRKVALRFGALSASRTPWEGQCERLEDVQLGDFCKWLVDQEAPSISHRKDEWWGYCSYQHFEALFEDMEDSNRAAANFAELLKDRAYLERCVRFKGECHV
eukprot:g23055.t1